MPSSDGASTWAITWSCEIDRRRRGAHRLGSRHPSGIWDLLPGRPVPSNSLTSSVARTPAARGCSTHTGVSGKRLLSLHGHNEDDRIDEVLALVDDGATVAVVSDAGTPAISDPGQRLRGRGRSGRGGHRRDPGTIGRDRRARGERPTHRSVLLRGVPAPERTGAGAPIDRHLDGGTDRRPVRGPGSGAVHLIDLRRRRAGQNAPLRSCARSARCTRRCGGERSRTAQRGRRARNCVVKSSSSWAAHHRVERHHRRRAPRGFGHPRRRRGTGPRRDRRGGERTRCCPDACTTWPSRCESDLEATRDRRRSVPARAGAPVGRRAAGRSRAVQEVTRKIIRKGVIEDADIRSGQDPSPPDRTR